MERDSTNFSESLEVSEAFALARALTQVALHLPEGWYVTVYGDGRIYSSPPMREPEIDID